MSTNRESNAKFLGEVDENRLEMLSEIGQVCIEALEKIATSNNRFEAQNLAKEAISKSFKIQAKIVKISDMKKIGQNRKN
jgi:hypothetical protein